MADGSRYLKCEFCEAVFDRRLPGDWVDGGAYRHGSEQQLLRDAVGYGWRVDGDKHYCSLHRQTAPQLR